MTKYVLQEVSSTRYYVKPSYYSWGFSLHLKDATYYDTEQEAQEIANLVNLSNHYTVHQLKPIAVVVPVPEETFNLIFIQQELRDIRIEVRTENNQPGGYPVIVFKKDDLPGFEYVLQENDNGTCFGFSPTDPHGLFMKIQEFKKEMKEDNL